MALFDKFIKKSILIEKKDVSPPPAQTLNLDFPTEVEQFDPEPKAQSQPEAILFSNALGGATLGNRNILVIVPNTNAEITQIVQNLQRGEACVVNLVSLSQEDAQRRLDFLSGVICAIGGTIKGLDQFKYVLTPQGLGVKS